MMWFRCVGVLLLSIGFVSAEVILHNQFSPTLPWGVWSAEFVAFDARFVAADDFDVPEGERWTVTRFTLDGFTNPPTLAPDRYRCRVFGNTGLGFSGGNTPNPAEVLFDGRISSGGPSAPTCDLSRSPPTLKPGKYWVAVNGEYVNSPINTTGAGWYWNRRNTTAGRNGEQFVWFSENLFNVISPPSTWLRSDSVYSNEADLAFFVQGSKAAVIPTTNEQTTSFVGVMSTQPNAVSLPSSSDSSQPIVGLIAGVAIAALICVTTMIVSAVLLLRKHALSISESADESYENGRLDQPPTGAVDRIQYDQAALPTSTTTVTSVGGYGSVSQRLASATVTRSSMYSGLRPDEIPPADIDIGPEVGRGAYGVVFKGTWRGGAVAIKQLILPAASHFSDSELSEFKVEAATMQALRPHVNVLQYLGYMTRPNLCIITEFMEHGSLAELIRSPAQISSERVQSLVKGICAGMVHLHAEGVCHRDLAARNILLGAGFQVKIADFGMSRTVDKETRSSQTKSDSGPLKWMAPEAIRFRIYSEKSDVWSFGVTLFELVTRREPFEALDPVQAALKVASEGLRLAIPPTAPIIIQHVMAECFRSLPEDRPTMPQIYRLLQEASPEEWS